MMNHSFSMHRPVGFFFLFLLTTSTNFIQLTTADLPSGKDWSNHISSDCENGTDIGKSIDIVNSTLADSELCSQHCLAELAGYRDVCEKCCLEQVSQNRSQANATYEVTTQKRHPTESLVGRKECHLTLEQCLRQTPSKRLACYNDTSSIDPKMRLCSTICSGTRPDYLKCDHFCKAFQRECLPTTTTYGTNTVQSTPERGDRFPNVVQCNVTLEMCRREAGTRTREWSITCFNDTSYITPRINLCSHYCSSHHLKCYDFCPDYLAQCGPPTTPSTSSTSTTWSPPESRWPNVLQCNVTVEMCRREFKSGTYEWSVTCFYDNSTLPPRVRLCSTFCLPPDSDRLKCHDFCPDFTEKCARHTTTHTSPKTAPPDTSPKLTVGKKIAIIITAVLIPAVVIFICVRKRCSKKRAGDHGSHEIEPSEEAYELKSVI